MGGLSFMGAAWSGLVAFYVVLVLGAHVETWYAASM